MKRGYTAVLFAIVVVWVNIYCAEVKKPVAVSNQFASLSDTTKYVGMETCRQCHSNIYDTYIHTGMGSSWDAASHAKSSAKFDAHALVYDKALDFYYKPYWDHDSLHVMEFRLNGKDTVYKRVETVNYIVGSGQHTNSHIMNTNGYLNQVPITFYTQKGQWDIAPGFADGSNSRFSRLIGLECMSCHNSYPKFTEGSENKYETVEHGINCERCHGPGGTHVAQKSAGMMVDTSKDIDYSIVNPSKLAINLQFDVCQRCHIQGNSVLNDDKSFFDFRPGMKLSDVMNVFMPVFSNSQNDHIMASHAERLKLSKCYTKTIEKISKDTSLHNSLRPYKNALTCITCHNPHVSVRVTDNDVFNNACKNCHDGQHDEVCPLTLQASNSKPQTLNCVKCHMQTSGALDIPHVKVTDHWIKIPYSEKKTDEIKKFVTISCINNPEPPKEAIGKAYIAYYEKFDFKIWALDSAKNYLDDNNADDIRKNFHSLIHLYFLKNDDQKILTYIQTVGDPMVFLKNKSYSNTDAWTAYRIGETYSRTGDVIHALQYYERASSLAPFEYDFVNKYGTALSDNNETEKAIAAFEGLIKEYPKFAPAWSNLGFLLLKTKSDTATARTYYEKSLLLNPDYEQGIINMAGLYVYKNQTADAIKYLTRTLKYHANLPKVKALLEQLKKTA